MATLNQFQHYSQGENTVTNNVLLMLSSLYEINPAYYEEFVSGIAEEPNSYEVIPKFLQQVNNKGDGFIDGYIQVKPSKIIIETKLYGLEFRTKLEKYAKSFEADEFKLLWHLSTNKFSQKEIDEINNSLKERENIKRDIFYSATFKDLVDQLKELAKNYPFEKYLLRLNEHFEAYCINMNLMPRSQHVLRAMACGQSFPLNEKHRFYFDVATRGFSDFDYLGIYKNKSVRFIGRVENEIVANWSNEGGFVLLNSKNEVTTEQIQRLETAIRDAYSQGWGVNEGHRFFLLTDFYKTDFEKVSPGGLFRVKYFHLEHYLKQVPNSLKEIAEQLTSLKWE